MKFERTVFEEKVTLFFSDTKNYNYKQLFDIQYLTIKV